MGARTSIETRRRQEVLNLAQSGLDPPAPLDPRALAPELMEGYGLTAREGDVVRCLFHGLSTKQIAIALRISPYTVQEHFTAIFDKVGVRSRRQLVGTVFRRFFEPRLVSLAASRERLSDARDNPSSPAVPSASRSIC